MANLSKYRLGTTVPMAVSLIDSGVSLSWSDVEILQLCVYSEAQKAFAGYCPFEVSGEDATKLLCSFPAKQQAFVGDYRLVAQLKYNDNEATYDALAFTLVGKTEEVEDVSTNPETVEVGITISTLPSSTITEILNACIKATSDAKAQTEAASEAEALRVQAEQARVTAENARVEAERLRAQAETARVIAETARVNAESARAEAERLRAQAETARANAETSRAEAEALRVQAEQARVTAENARVTAETARVIAERLRAQAETARANAETSRAEAEALRVQAEQARVTAENARVTAETARAEAERLRAQAETQRESDCQTAINEMKETINAMSLGLFTVTCEDGDLYLITNGAGSAIKGADITDDNVLEITIDA